MAIFTVNGAGPKSLLPHFQVAAFALQVRGTFETKIFAFGEKSEDSASPVGPVSTLRRSNKHDGT